jgi:hypothetical protein
VIMVRAAAKEPAIVASAITFLEFIGASFPGNIGAGGRRNRHTAFIIGVSKNPTTAGLSNPTMDVTHVGAVELPGQALTIL